MPLISHESFDRIFRTLASAILFGISSCAYNPLDLHGLRPLPKSANVDEHVHLTPTDIDQIVRAIGKKTAQPVDYIYNGGPVDSIEVICGYSDVSSENIPRLTGYEFTLERINGKWTIIKSGFWMR